MKAIATLALLLSLPVSHITPRPVPPPGKVAQARPRKGGKWYFAANGHAVYCYGPVVTIPNVRSGLHRVATLCTGDRTMVELRD